LPSVLYKNAVGSLPSPPGSKMIPRELILKLGF
jgi:hypothetical protein